MLLDSAKTQKPLVPPKKYAAFSARDSRSIESAFQRLIDHDHDTTQREGSRGDIGDTNDLKEPTNPVKRQSSGDLKELGRPETRESLGNTSINEASDSEKGGRVKVPVNEDFLFDVDIEARELAPAYWLGPIYDVRRGSWFYQEGSSLRPCEENQVLRTKLRLRPRILQSLNSKRNGYSGLI